MIKTELVNGKGGCAGCVYNSQKEEGCKKRYTLNAGKTCLKLSNGIFVVVKNG